MSTVSRAGTKSSAVTLFDHEAEQADHDAAVHRSWDPGAIGRLGRDEGVAVSVKKGWFVGAGP
jgi:hypothetical protein